MSKLGLGVLIENWGGDEETVRAIKDAKDKTIRGIRLEDGKDRRMADILVFAFDDDVLSIWDDYQKCCEDRYMHTDDQLASFHGAQFLGAEIRDAPSGDCEYWEEHEIQFLLIHTSLGTFTVETHNVHNGYYGGFKVKACLVGSVEVQENP